MPPNRVWFFEGLDPSDLNRVPVFALVGIALKV